MQEQEGQNNIQDYQNQPLSFQEQLELQERQQQQENLNDKTQEEIEADEYLKNVEQKANDQNFQEEIEKKMQQKNNQVSNQSQMKENGHNNGHSQQQMQNTHISQNNQQNNGGQSLNQLNNEEKLRLQIEEQQRQLQITQQLLKQQQIQMQQQQQQQFEQGGFIQQPLLAQNQPTNQHELYKQSQQSPYNNAQQTQQNQAFQNVLPDLQKIEQQAQQFREKQDSLSQKEQIETTNEEENIIERKKILKQLLVRYFQQEDSITFEKEFTELKNFVLEIINRGEHKNFFNQFFNLMEKFSGTYLEWNLKILFNQINEKLSEQDYFHELVKMIPQEGGRFSENIQLNEEQQQLVVKLKELVQVNEVIKKNEAITTISLLLGKCDNFEVQFHIFSTILTPIFQQLVKMPQKIHNQIKINFYYSLLDLVERYIFPSEYSIIIETANMHGTRNFILKNEKSYLQNHPQVYYTVATILNQVLLLPSQTLLQIRALQIIRRFYYYFPVLHPLVENPIILVLANIALYSKEASQEKDASTFLYKLLQSEETPITLKQKLNDNEHIQMLKANKYYSIKALTYPNDIDIVYKTNNLNLQIMFPFYKKIESGAYFHHNCIISKPNSLLYWNFKTLDYDLSFGLYKIDTLQPLSISDYQNSDANNTVKPINSQDQIKTRSIIQLQRSNSYQQPVSGFMLIKLPGFYRIIFDNTYSYWRAKELFYSIHILEP